jgi:signal transduction histidine kinase
MFALRRALFWRVYLTLLASLTLAAVLAALAWHNRIIIQHQAHMRHSMHLPMMLLLVGAAVGLGAYPAVARLTHRLERLKTSVDAWGQGRLDIRAEVQGRDEVAAVAASFNAAAERVEKLLSAHRDLLAHASHELRSPLARLSMAVEMYAEQPDQALRPQIMGDIEELSALVDEILLASSLDQAAGDLPREPVDCLEFAAEEAARAGAEVRRVGPDDASFVVDGSQRLLRRMIRNLIDNADRHGAPPVEVSVESIASPPSIEIDVSDGGPGLAAADRERVFEPFYRPAGRAEADGSWGLGLSIVRQIAERHGGAVLCRPREGGGAQFVVTLPRRR